MACRQIYAVYRSGKNIADGTAEELARVLGVSVKTVRKLASPSYQNKDKGKRLVIIKLDKEGNRK